MKPQLLFIFSLFSSIAGLAQEDVLLPSDSIPTDSTLVAPAAEEEVKTPPKVFRMSFVIDYGKPAISLLSDEQRYEGGVNFTFFDHYSILGEYGYGSLNPKNALQNGSYYSEGSYFRIGGGYMNNLDAKSKLGLSIRYGQSQFTDEGKIFVESASGIQEGYQTTFGPRKSEGRWVEVVITSESRLIFDQDNPEAKINHLLSIGFHARLRFLSSYDRYPLYDTYSIPGYGRTVNNPNPAINLFLRISPF